ncbi:MAG: hypothetical protein GVY28_08040 [Alphaproteobacteria bacterium]|nr:hypothetical protein [Alphaproteobacteria bacterium]
MFVQRLRDLPGTLSHLLHPGDVVLISGAGDIGTLAARLPERIRQGAAEAEER